ncbi:MAG TPA: hypothetical protein VHA14_17305, partial [Bryobacteraceae bacterium]|nr:hypothetical protein [Bryobacteraceae bacterium]
MATPSLAPQMLMEQLRDSRLFGCPRRKEKTRARIISLMSSAFGLPGPLIPAKETKIFDPFDLATGSGGSEVLDPSVVFRDGCWWMFLAGQAEGYGPPELFSAALPPGASLSEVGWKLTRDAGGILTPLARRDASQPWDGNGGRHCPSYVKGWDSRKKRWV